MNNYIVVDGYVVSGVDSNVKYIYEKQEVEKMTEIFYKVEDEVNSRILEIVEECIYLCDNIIELRVAKIKQEV